MSLAEAPSPAACPACAATDAKSLVAAKIEDASKTLRLSVPTIHCAGCINGVERTLGTIAGVSSARVNLTQKRVTVEAAPHVSAPALVNALKQAGFEAHELDAAVLATSRDDAQSRDLLMRLGVAGFAMMNVMLLSVAVWSGATDATRDLFHWISATIAIPAVAFSAQPFFRSAWGALRGGRLNMDVPISLAILLAALMSVYETAQGGDHAYFDAALSLTFFLLAGRYLDFRTRQAARSAANELSALEVPRSTRLVNGTEELVDVAGLRIGDILRVRPGERFAVDGQIVRGDTEVDRSLLTGETLATPATTGSPVSAGEINLTGPVDVEVLKAAEDSALRQIADLVAVAEEAKSRYTSLADRAARIYAPVVHLLALAAFLGWFAASGDWRLAMNIAVATLIITCPCALGLAVPAVATAASGRLFRRGMLIKHATTLERLAEIDTVVFDKTGTLTMGNPVLKTTPDLPVASLGVAKALAQTSNHPLARALAEAITTEPASIDTIREIPGHGVQGRWNGLTVRLGRADWVGAAGGEDTATYLRIADGDPVAFRFSDRLRPGAAEAVTTFRDAGFAVYLLSGDTETAVRAVSAPLGIESALAGLLPEEKATWISQKRAEGGTVLMVGDGLNDTAALAAANASISPASALDASRVISDVVLLGDDFSNLPQAVFTARKAKRRILENFAIAATYNAIAIPVALAGLATPLAAALAMSTSSILVSLNAFRLR